MSEAEELAKAEWAKNPLSSCLPWEDIDTDVRRLKIIRAERDRMNKRMAGRSPVKGAFSEEWFAPHLSEE